ncbi:MAG: ATP-binding protein [Candidatus Omnitrophica bacterium]|nr:ATP-binding protein [Candidatus Omnitrophota bacterium]
MINLRPELERHLQQRLNAFRDGFRHNLALIGPPGSGKTFQLHQLLGHPEPHALVIYCALYRESCRSFLQRLLCAILQAGSGPTKPGTTSPQLLEALLRHAEPHLPKTAAAIRAIDGLLARRLYGEAFNRALDTVPVLMEERQRPALLILDEFLFLEELGLTHAFHELGKRVMTWPSTLFILASSSPHRARTILRERLQLLFGQFELLTLEALNREAATAWVQHELKGVRGTKTAAPFLIDWLGGSPWYLAVWLKRLKELATLARSAQLTEALFLQTAWDLLGNPDGTLHQWCRSRVDALAHTRQGARALEALIHVASGARTMTELSKRVGRGGLSEALQLLVEHDVAQRSGVCWRVTDPVLRCWLSTVLLSQRADARLPEADVRQRVEQAVRDLWTEWTHAQTRSLSEQVVRLFNRFADDTVALDSKTGRLPKFESISTHEPVGPGAESYLIADGPGRRWCATVQLDPVDENAIAAFDAFCRTQIPRPSRKVVIMKSSIDQNARVVAKAADMWVWSPEDLKVLMELYHHG